MHLWLKKKKKKKQLLFKIIAQIDIMSISCEIALMMGQHGYGNGLVPSGNKPLPGPKLTQIYVATWCH